MEGGGNMNIIEEIISKQLMAAKYHQRTITLLVNPYLLDLFKEVFANIDSEVEESPKHTKQFTNGGYVRLESLIIHGRSTEHTNAVVLVNAHDADQKAVDEAQMIVGNVGNKRGYVETIQIYTDFEGKWV